MTTPFVTSKMNVGVLFTVPPSPVALLPLIRHSHTHKLSLYLSRVCEFTCVGVVTYGFECKQVCVDKVTSVEVDVVVRIGCVSVCVYVCVWV